MSNTGERSRQQTATEYGLTAIEFEDEWWGNEKFGEWSTYAAGVVDGSTEDAYHIGVGQPATPEMSEVTPGITALTDWMYDVWVPRSKVTCLAEPDWCVFPPETDEPHGRVCAALRRETEYGTKVCLWGDTREALAKDEDALLDDYFSSLHPSFNGDHWTVDAVNGVLVSTLTGGGYEVAIAGQFEP